MELTTILNRVRPHVADICDLALSKVTGAMKLGEDLQMGDDDCRELEELVRDDFDLRISITSSDSIQLICVRLKERLDKLTPSPKSTY